MIRQEKGFTMVELLVAMVVFLFAMAAATSAFLPLVNQFKQQGKIAETQMEGIIGLELLRIDLESAGYGLPWYVFDIDDNFKQDWSGLTYTEALDEGDATKPYHLYNDADATNPKAPRGVVMGNNVGTATNLMGIHGSDYLVIKATNVRMADEMQKWSYVRNDAGVVQPPHVWGDPRRDFDSDETKVIALKPSFAKDAYNILMTSSPPTPTYYSTISSFKTSPPETQLIPLGTQETILIYAVGLESDTDLRMPFNRADYYISTANTPDRCAEGTGVIIKTVISQENGIRGPAGIPLLDCVADMQVILGLDMDDDGTVGTYTDYDHVSVTGSMVSAPANSDTGTPTLSDVEETLKDAEKLRDRLKEVRVYILAHEGQMDPRFNFGADVIDVGEFLLGHSGPADHFDLTTIPDHEYYRWKVYTMVVAPDNLKPKHEE